MSVGTATQIDLDDPILKHIHPSFAKLHPEQTVREALDYVRCNPPEGRIVYFYVVDGMIDSMELSQHAACCSVPKT